MKNLLKIFSLNSFNDRQIQDNYLRWQVIAFITCYLLILLRSIPRLQGAHLWGEDGALFLTQAFGQGKFSSIFMPYDGYYHVLPRILAIASLNLSIDYLPHLIILASSLLYALAASLIVSEDYAYIIPNIFYRLIIAISLCFLPGMWEVVGNAANLHSILFLFLLMWGIRSLDKKTSWWQTATAFLICTSAGEVIVLLPLFIARIILQNRQSKNFINKPDVIIVISIFFWSTINFMLSISRPLSFTVSAKYLHFLDYLGFLFLLVSHRLIFRPLFGQEISMVILKPDNRWLFFILVFGLGFYIIRLFYYNLIIIIFYLFWQFFSSLALLYLL